MILRAGTRERVQIRLGTPIFEGLFEVPERPVGFVLLAQASGHGHDSSRNQELAEDLREAGLGTLLIDLLTPKEDQRYTRRFDISLLTERLEGITEWLNRRLSGTGLAIGYFVESTGTAAAIAAAVHQGGSVGAIVSRSGRPDLAEVFWPEVETPTLLIVGGKDPAWIQAHITAYQKLRAPKELAILPGANREFEEPGALLQVGRRAADWFCRYLTPALGEMDDRLDS